MTNKVLNRDNKVENYRDQKQFSPNLLGKKCQKDAGQIKNLKKNQFFHFVKKQFFRLNDETTYYPRIKLKKKN